MNAARQVEPHASTAVETVAVVAPDHEWARLAAEARGASIFQSWEWIAAWTEHFLPPRDTAQLTRIACAHGGALLAQAWTYRYRDDGHDRWLLVGSGNTDTLDPLIDDAHAELAADSLFTAFRSLARHAPIELLQLSAGSPLVAHARAAGCTVTPAEPCLLIDVQQRAGLESTVRPTLLRNIAYARRRLDREGTWTIADVTPHTLTSSLQRLFQLHAARWHARRQTGVLADNRVRSFHHRVATLLLGRGLVLRALHLNGHTIACHYGFRTADRETYYIGGFDPAFARLSPGVLLLAHAFERARSDRLHYLDLLRGREPYKYDWGAREQPHVRLTINH